MNKSLLCFSLMLVLFSCNKIEKNTSNPLRISSTNNFYMIPYIIEKNKIQIWGSVRLSHKEITLISNYIQTISNIDHRILGIKKSSNNNYEIQTGENPTPDSGRGNYIYLVYSNRSFKIKAISFWNS